MLIAEIAQPVPVARSFDYEVPARLAGAARPGMRVKAPFGPRRLTGIILSIREGAPERPLKPIDALLDAEPVLPPEMIELARWMARRYAAAVGECCKALTPSFIKTLEAPVAPPQALAAPPGGFELTRGQAEALEGLLGRLRSKTFSSGLLFGVPASGKTEVYLRLMREAIAQGGQVLYLLPEISLTRPFFEELSRRAGFTVALWHSKLGIKERRNTWLGIRRGEIKAVVGARSASLLPFRDLRLAVVDEEHDESYKQDGQAPHYHAREVVLERARRTGALVVLGSATPSLESIAAVESGDTVLHALPERISALAAPSVEIVPKPDRPGACLSGPLLEKIKDRLCRREQVILLVNRRGFSNFVICKKCGWVCRCPTCAIAFIHHQDQDKGFGLLCHHCGQTAPVPKACGKCSAPVLTFSGAGTQRVVAEIEALLKGARVLRLDSDTVAKEKTAAQELRIYDRFRDRKADILVGTKLVAKGYHFPDVTLVGVVDADTMLHMPDFRAAERTVQLLIQAAGRSGRAEKAGEVVLQTENPEHYAIQAVARGDYLRYTKQELQFRKELFYPPAAPLVRMLYSGESEEETIRQADDDAAAWRLELGDSVDILGPSPAVYQKLRGKYRFHLLLKFKEAASVEPFLSRIAAAKNKGARQVFVDPYDLF